MTSVIVEADRFVGAPAPFDVLFGQDDGATRIWMIRMVPGPDLRVGLHRHEGDEIWRVRRGGIRITVGERRLECGAGQLVVIPPNTIHGVAVIDNDTEVEAIGEIGMGEWITVIDAEGRRREVEVHVPFVPWHRRAPEGVAPTDLDDMIAMLHSTAHLLLPTARDPATSNSLRSGTDTGTPSHRASDQPHLSTAESDASRAGPSAAERGYRMLVFALLLVIAAMALGILGVVVKGLLYLLFTGIGLFIIAFFFGALWMRRRTRRGRHTR